MVQLLKSIKGNLQWIRREKNKEADRLCDELKNRIQQSSKEITILENRVPKGHFTLGGIGSGTVNGEDKAHIWQYYCSMVKKGARKNIDDIIAWGENKHHRNSQNGRRYFVERFIEKNHLPKDLNRNRIKHAFKIEY